MSLTDRDFYRNMGQEFGPVSWNDLKSLVEVGTLSSADEVRVEHSSNWQSLTRLLADSAAEPTPPPTVISHSLSGIVNKPSVAAPPTQNWYCEMGDQVHGPLDFEALVALAQLGRLSATDRVRFGLDGVWRKVESVGRLMTVLPFQKKGEILISSTEDSVRTAAERASVVVPVDDPAPAPQVAPQPSMPAAAPAARPRSLEDEIDEEFRGPLPSRLPDPPTPRPVNRNTNPTSSKPAADAPLPLPHFAAGPVSAPAAQSPLPTAMPVPAPAPVAPAAAHPGMMNPAAVMNQTPMGMQPAGSLPSAPMNYAVPQYSPSVATPNPAPNMPQQLGQSYGQSVGGGLSNGFVPNQMNQPANSGPYGNSYPFHMGVDPRMNQQNNGMIMQAPPPMQPSNSELAYIIERWPRLPMHIRETIVTLVRTAES